MHDEKLVAGVKGLSFHPGKCGMVCSLHPGMSCTL